MVLYVEIGVAAVCAGFVAWRMLRSSLFRARKGDRNHKSAPEQIYDYPEGRGGVG